MICSSAVDTHTRIHDKRRLLSINVIADEASPWSQEEQDPHRLGAQFYAPLTATGKGRSPLDLVARVAGLDGGAALVFLPPSLSLTLRHFTWHMQMIDCKV